MQRFSQFVVVVATSILPTTIFAAPPTWLSKASESVIKQYENHSLNETFPTILVYMKDEAKFAIPRPPQPRTERVAAVFNSLVQTAERSQSAIRTWLKQEAITYRSYHISNMIAADQVSKAQLESILQRHDVLRVVSNPNVKNIMPKTERLSFEEPKGPGANLISFGATRVWEELKVKGENIVIGGQDTGVRWDHNALKTHYRGWNGSSADHSYSWHDSVHRSVGGSSSCGYNVAIPCDDHDHGTHTIGTVVGDDNAGNQIGVAPGAKWIACRNMDAGIGNPEMYTECFQWFLAPWPQNGDPVADARPDMAPHVINNSWGCPKSEGCDGGEFERVLTALRAAGIFVVASAGNEGPGCSTIKDGPAFHSSLVLSVGAVDHRNGSIASFSSRGPSTFDNKVGPHVTAPGVNVRSAVRSGGYAEFGWSGTSMAGPHVVGEVALLWSAIPNLIGNIEETEGHIKSSSIAKTSTQSCGGVPGDSLPNNTFGFGIANAYEVLRGAK